MRGNQPLAVGGLQRIDVVVNLHALEGFSGAERLLGGMERGPDAGWGERGGNFEHKLADVEQLNAGHDGALRSQQAVGEVRAQH